jgi:hypothetical protein
MHESYAPVLNRATDGSDDIGQRIGMKQRQNTLSLMFPVATFLKQLFEVLASLRTEFRIASPQHGDLFFSILGRSMLWIDALVAARASYDDDFHVVIKASSGHSTEMLKGRDVLPDCRFKVLAFGEVNVFPSQHHMLMVWEWSTFVVVS